MDLQRLKIDRDRSGGDRGPARGRPRWLLPVLGGLGLLVLLWLIGGPGRRALEGLLLPRVRVAEVAESSPAAAAAVRGTAANGHVVAARRAALSTDLPGRIVELNVTEGSYVEEGDIVARLFAGDYEAALERSEAEFASAIATLARSRAARDAARSAQTASDRTLEAVAARLREARAGETLARKDRERYERLVAEGVSAPRDLDSAVNQADQTAARRSSAASEVEAARASAADAEARAAVANSEVEVARARVKAAGAGRDQAAALLQKTVVRAPFDGVVVLKDAEVGEVVSPASTAGSNARGSVCTIVDLDSLEVQADVPETSLSAVSVGAPVSVFLDAHPDLVYGARVTRIWPTANRQKATIEVRAEFDEPDELLRPEMGVRIVFLPSDAEPVSSEGPALLVSERALVREEGREGVFVVERGRVRLRSVTVGPRRGSRVTIESGLSDGERVVLDPPEGLEDGDRVLVGDG